MIRAAKVAQLGGRVGAWVDAAAGSGDAEQSASRRETGPPQRVPAGDYVDWCGIERLLREEDEEHYARHPAAQLELHELLRNHAAPELDEALRRAEGILHRTGQVLLTGISTSNLALVALAARFGRVTSDGNDHRALVYDVTPTDGSEPSPLSHQRAAFPPHSDSAWLPRPHDLVAMAGVTPVVGSAARSITVHVDSIVAALHPTDVGVLCHEVFPATSDGRTLNHVPILERHADRYRIRYRADLMSVGKEIAGIDPGAWGSFQRLTAVIASCARSTFVISAGEILLLDNTRVLHGRTAIPNGVQRLLKRLKLRDWSSGMSDPLGRGRENPRAKLSYLVEHGAQKAPHGRSTLLCHLVSTHNLLLGWGCGEDVCNAGLFHSVYGTGRYRTTLLDDSDRVELVGLIGAWAERVAYLFGMLDRCEFLAQLDQRDPMVRNRLTGELLPITAKDRDALCHILAANRIEQHSRHRREVAGPPAAAAYRRLTPFLNPTAADALRAGLRAG